MMDFPRTDRTVMRRAARRASYDRAAIYAIFDEAFIAAVAVTLDGSPHVQPMIHRRIGDRLIFHGLATNRLLGAIAAGAEACINVAIVDALVLARRIETHSMLYRSATAYGRGYQIPDEIEKLELMGQVFASLAGAARLAGLPPLAPGYLSGTIVVAVPLEEAVAKVNSHVDTEAGPDAIWSGLMPLQQQVGLPQPDARTVVERLVPASELQCLYESRGR